MIKKMTTRQMTGAEYAQKATEATKEKDAIKDIIVDYAEKK
jgi:hypothetical protein